MKKVIFSFRPLLALALFSGQSDLLCQSKPSEIVRLLEHPPQSVEITYRVTPIIPNEFLKKMGAKTPVTASNHPFLYRRDSKRSFSTQQNPSRTNHYGNGFNSNGWWNVNGVALTSYATERDMRMQKSGSQNHEDIINFGIAGAKRGTFKFTGTNFTAASDSGAAITGSLSLSENGMPLRVDYRVEGKPVTFATEYESGSEREIAELGRLPLTFVRKAIQSDGTAVPVIKVEITSFKIFSEDFQDALMNPYVIFQIARQQMVSNGVYHINQNGNWVAAKTKSEALGKTKGRKLAIASLVVVAGGFLSLLVYKMIASKNKKATV